jgi:hypothetical protein
MSFPEHKQFQQLLDIATEETGEYGNYTFEPVGLILLPTHIPDDDFCTLPDTMPFAETGTDGVHFRFLAIDGKYSDLSPVIMTVPNCGDYLPNIVVGEDLREFLALGCKVGYFLLDELMAIDEPAYTTTAFLKELELQKFNADFEQEEKDLLLTITSTFNLTPWRNPLVRLKELRLKYSNYLNLPVNSQDLT